MLVVPELPKQVAAEERILQNFSPLLGELKNDFLERLVSEHADFVCMQHRAFSLIVSGKFEVKFPECCEQRRLQLFPGFHPFSTSTGSDMYVNSLNSPQFTEGFTRFVYRRCCRSAGTLARCAYVDDPRAPAARILVRFIRRQNVDHPSVPSRTSVDRQQ